MVINSINIEHITGVGVWLIKTYSFSITTTNPILLYDNLPQFIFYICHSNLLITKTTGDEMTHMKHEFDLHFFHMIYQSGKDVELFITKKEKKMEAFIGKKTHNNMHVITENG